MLQGDQLVSSETLRDPVDVHGSEAQRVGQVGLGQGQPDRMVFSHADHPLAQDEFAQEIGDTTGRAPPPEGDNALPEHRLLLHYTPP
jgi:hypothetical protein